MALNMIVLWSAAALLGAAGAFNLLAPRRWRERTANWNYPAELTRGGGIVELLAALFLVLPELRIVGLAFAALAVFAAGVSLVERSHYLAAAAGIAMMTALVPAALAVHGSI
jgi:hypothetical protein